MKKPTIIAGTSFGLLLIFLGFTNPATLPSFLLVIPFTLLFTTLYAISYILLRKMGLRRLRSLRLGIVCAGLPVSLLLLQSIGQLTVRDVLTILIFFGVAYFYISRIAAQPTNRE